MAEPTYEEMLPAKYTKASRPGFIKKLEVGIPTRYDPPQGSALGLLTQQQAMIAAGKRAKIGISTKVIDNELWVVRLKPEHDPFNEANK